MTEQSIQRASDAFRDRSVSAGNTERLGSRTSLFADPVEAWQQGPAVEATQSELP